MTEEQFKRAQQIQNDIAIAGMNIEIIRTFQNLKQGKDLAMKLPENYFSGKGEIRLYDGYHGNLCFYPGSYISEKIMELFEDKDGKITKGLQAEIDRLNKEFARL